ncbi:MAG: hypothetical protein HFJ37_04605 [Clostridia bacterium]|nr:hypothetical protein [Clostridia bacterium]
MQFVEPIEYLIKYPSTLTILEYKVNEIANKNFYIKEHNQKYNIKEIKQILVKLKIINFFQTRGAKMHFFEQTYERVKKFLKFFYKFGIQTPKKFTGIVGGNIL